MPAEDASSNTGPTYPSHDHQEGWNMAQGTALALSKASKKASRYEPVSPEETQPQVESH